ncbi:MAG TPA: type II secretion system F family protein [Actinomycetota bacterium]|nr:type II secretion system F family protein [Actinomycetota bacterium]
MGVPVAEVVVPVAGVGIAVAVGVEVPVAVGVLALLCLVLALDAAAAATRARVLDALGALPAPERSSRWPWLRSRPGPRPPTGRASLVLLGSAGSVGLGLFGMALAGLVGAAAGVLGGASLPPALARRARRREAARLEGQVAEAAESVALALRSGRSVLGALEAAADELEPPMGPLLARVVRDQRLGTPLAPALRELGERVGAPEGRMFVLLLQAGTRSGGNLSKALDEVARTVRHRAALRRELRALSAQGRISGAVLGALPVGFFLLVAATSRGELGPVLRSGPGAAMVASGLVLEALGFLWIRRILAGAGEGG